MISNMDLSMTSCTEIEENMQTSLKTCDINDVKKQDILCGRSNYLIQDFLGEGSFGFVAKCLKLDTSENVAIKILKPRNDQTAEHEAAVLTQLNTVNADESCIVKWFEHFDHHGLTCLAFEMLDRDLEEFMDERNFDPIPLCELRPLVHQLAKALATLKTHGLIHCDLKPNNVMIVDRQQKPYRVKLIDFGLCRRAKELKVGDVVQVPPYRAPEVFLGLPLTEAIDMWSLGCVAANGFLGCGLFPGEDEYQVFEYIMHTVGQPEDDLLNKGLYTRDAFTKDPDSNNAWRFLTPQEFYRIPGYTHLYYDRGFKTLDDLIKFNTGVPVAGEAGKEDRRMFVDLLKKMLTPDSAKRITPAEVLQHPFLTMSHLVDLVDSNSYATASYQAMAVYLQARTLVSSSRSSPIDPEDVETNIEDGEEDSDIFCGFWEALKQCFQKNKEKIRKQWQSNGLPTLGAWRAEEAEEAEHLRVPQFSSGGEMGAF